LFITRNYGQENHPINSKVHNFKITLQHTIDSKKIIQAQNSNTTIGIIKHIRRKKELPQIKTSMTGNSLNVEI
jgi:hypothetical protein